MSEKPILFSTPMVQAILEGRKTQTRRVINLKGVSELDKPSLVFDGDYRAHIYLKSNLATMPDTSYPIKKPHQPGDILWVRETWSKDYAGHYIYKANYSERGVDELDLKFKPSIHMPRAAARLFLRVTGHVRAERVREITNADAKAEGIWIGEPDKERYAQSEAYRLLADNLAVAQFGDLWNSLNTKRGYGWDANPFVWVYTFERIDAP